MQQLALFYYLTVKYSAHNQSLPEEVVPSARAPGISMLILLDRAPSHSSIKPACINKEVAGLIV